ncbi:MAG TPA: HDOD domain-containing protein [Rhodocyclaceae bacterium]|nr:HDOD domain-containing protein [Rhodocyclaceae bacterium]
MTPTVLVQEVSTLFSLPDVVVRLNSLIEGGDTSIRELAEVVELDPGLTTAVLKLANSSWYGLPSRVDTVSSALMMIGQKALGNLALSASIVRTFRGIPDSLLDMQAFWDNSITCGVIARQLGRAGNVREEERLFIAGLLLGVGRLVFIARRPEQYRQVLAVAPQGDAAMVEIERRLFGFDYAELGAELLKAWKLPEILQFLVGSHLSPLLAKAWQKEAAIAFTACDIAARVAPAMHGHQAVADYVPDFKSEIWQRLGLEPTAIPDIIAASMVQTFEVLQIVNPKGAMVF